MATATDLFDFLSPPAPVPETAVARAPSPAFASARRAALAPAAASVFRCPYCPRRFASGQALGGHQNAHRRDRGGGAAACPYLRLPRGIAQAQPPGGAAAAALSPALPGGAGCTAPARATAACDVDLDLDLDLHL